MLGCGGQFQFTVLSIYSGLLGPDPLRSVVLGAFHVKQSRQNFIPLEVQLVTAGYNLRS